ncbi:glycoside hydrolase family 3 C-terminal domain-containing protein [Streptomyces hoynatensis]|uniref:Exo-alpha-(1->6)-L-arabinopyranosidase n=1 Tax=Streptomyces hoynatensis TaxID=1141874 RepID=A0A3A9YU21_9ACTN|nr:glycoside hydrolase family 3 C-terminal domain-containing protein [Streptomyces hoynatensis]RKN38756.1 carbohydrate-binding protein [Streptomyces hoynatensis]
MTDAPVPFRDPRLPFAERVADLLGRLTLPERVAMLHQAAPAVERLGLAPFRTGQEALHGVAWMGKATVFPQAVGLGATWNDELVRRVGEAAGREARAMRAREPKVGLNVWSPTVNLLRHPLWGRNEEGYAEDPHLTAALATAYTRGLRGDHPVYWRTAPLLKHWLAHNHEWHRDTASTSVRLRVLHEYELPAFRGPVRAGTVIGVMPAYNLVNGRPNHLSPLLESELRTWTDRSLVVCSDAFAPGNIAGSQGYLPSHEEGLAAALRAGVDSFTDDGPLTLKRLNGALEAGLIDPGDVDRAVARLLDMRFLLGEFDPDLDPFAADAAFDTPEHRALALEAAEQAVVLLKNDGLLPLRPGTRVAVVGLLADEVKLDWYSGSLLRRTSPLAGLRERAGADSVTFAEGADLVRLRAAGGGWLRVPPAPEAPRAEAQAALDPALLSGRTDLPALTLTGEEAEATGLHLIDWGGGVLTLRAPDGRYLSAAGDGLVRASAEQPGGWVVQETFSLEPHGGGHLLRHLGTGNHVWVAADGLRVAAPPEEAGPEGEATAGAAGEPGAPQAGEVFFVETLERGAEAVARAAAEADVVVVVAGNDPHINGRETEDRRTLALPPQQERLWRAAHAANPRTALVLTSAYPYAVPEADATLPALLWTAHGGQAAGTALARVLFGDVSPGGRLPQTWYAGDGELPGMLDYDLIAARSTYLYYDGVPLYPFGHGLSYTAFDYTALDVRLDGEELTAEVTVANAGAVPGDEVVQLYARALRPSVPRPHRWLIGHRRIHLAPGEERRLSFTVPVGETFGFFDVGHGRWTLEPGPYEVQAGASSRDIRRTAAFALAGEPVPPRPVLRAGLAAASFDESEHIELTDLTPESGDAVTRAAGATSPATLRYLRCDFGQGVTGVRLRAARGEPGAARVELRLTGAEGTGSGITLTVPSTGDDYAYATISAPLTGLASGVGEVRLTLHGAVRVDRLEFDS